MRTLIIQLPIGMPSPNQPYPHAVVQTQAQAPMLNVQWAAANLLPGSERQTDVVALLPAPAVSWHRVNLPPGLHKQAARLQAALQGLLEDRLLDDPSGLHMALQPDWKNHPQPWVAVCDRAWLQGHMQALEQAGQTVHRIVPELNPSSALALGAQVQLTALGDEATGWLWMSHPERGVWGLPLAGLQPATLGLTASAFSDQRIAMQAEPGAVDCVSRILDTPARLMASHQHWLNAAASSWDLAQFDFRASARTRQLKAWQRGLSHFWHHMAYRPLRWGLWVLLAGQLLGLNAWAWKTRTDWQAQQLSWAAILRETFPQTQVVIDPPVQMAQEVERLRRSAGQLSAGDLESMLSSLGNALPLGLAAPSQWVYQSGQLRLNNFKPSGAEQKALQKTLEGLGYRWRADGDAWLITVAPVKETRP